MFGYICGRDPKDPTKLEIVELEGSIWATHGHFFHQHIGCPADVSGLVESATWGNKTDTVGMSYELQLNQVFERELRQALRHASYPPDLFKCPTAT